MNPSALPFVTLVAFDVETTGLDPEKDEIIEVAGVKFTLEKQGGKLVTKKIGEFQNLVKPTMFIPEEATRVNKITNQMVDDAPPVKTVLAGFLRFCGLSSVLVAHNASFDAAFIGKAVRKSGIMLPANPVIDSLKFIRKIMPEYASHRLGEVAKKLGDQCRLELRGEDLHRALYDCEVLKEVLCACLRKRYQDKELTMDQALKSLEKVHGQALAFSQFA